MSELVRRLSQGKHAVSMSRYNTLQTLCDAIRSGFVLVKFTQTNGGTEVGFKIDEHHRRIDFEERGPTLQLAGQFTLDYVTVLCQVEIDKQSLLGQGVLSELS